MKLKILCIDDQIELHDGFEINLEETGQDLIFFHNPETAFEYIEKNHKTICFIFSDLKMPEMTGFELREKMLSKYKDIPFCIFTGFYDKQMAKSAMNLSICEFLSKPGGFENLHATYDKFSKERISNIEDEFMMVNSFLEESTPMLDEIEDLILGLENEPENRDEILKTYFRLLHTIKGTASCVGLNIIAEFSHKYEDFVTLLQKKEIPLNGQSTDILLRGFDRIKYLYHVYSEGISHDFNVPEEVKVFNPANVTDGESANQAEPTENTSSNNSPTGAKLASSDQGEKVSVFMSTLDEFMEMSGELTVVRNRIVKTASNLEAKYQGDKEFELLGEYLSEMHKVSSNLQNNITELRKSNVATVARPLVRAVRDISKNANKQVDFKFIDNGLRVDAVIYRALNSTLIHLVRNGLDHGLETQEERVKTDKPEVGSLEVSIEESGEEIIVNIIDDGRGIDPAVIKAKAIEKELYSADELDRMPSQRLFQIIFESGFSTAAAVTDISGRGVGMDMVLSTIKEINGKVIINSELGKGTHFKIYLPIPKSVLIVNSLMVNVAESTFAISLDEIKETLLIDQKNMQAKVEVMGDSMLLRHNDSLIPLIDIGAELQISEKKINRLQDSDCSLNIILSRIDGFEFGIIVDHVNDFEEVVVKQLCRSLSNLTIYGGSTLHGDGEIAMYFDLKEIANYFNFEEKDIVEDYSVGEVVEITDKKQIMIFELLGGTKYGFPLEQVDRLEVLHTDTFEHTGSLVGTRYRDNFLPLIDLSVSMHDQAIIHEDGIESVNSIIISVNDQSYGVIIKNIDKISTPIDEIDSSTADGLLIMGTYYINDEFVTMLNLTDVTKLSGMKKTQESKDNIQAVDTKKENSFSDAA